MLLTFIYMWVVYINLRQFIYSVYNCLDFPLCLSLFYYHSLKLRRESCCLSNGSVF